MARLFAEDKQSVENLVTWYQQVDGMPLLDQWDTDTLRQQLLAINGISVEMADSILLHAFNRPVFTVNSDTRRLFRRLGVVPEGLSHDETRHLIEISLEGDVDLFQEFHALIAKQCRIHCLKVPLCEACVLASQCYH
ncbi:MAG: hypothetical protein KAH22_09325 [Thiotrichaceae bacterium]|nr:hypothetical protein [Thiotrichaceae bacterium]